MFIRYFLLLISLVFTYSLTGCGGGGSGGNGGATSSSPQIEPIPDSLGRVALNTDNGRQFAIGMYRAQSIYIRAMQEIGYPLPVVVQSQSLTSQRIETSRSPVQSAVRFRNELAIASTYSCDTGEIQVEDGIGMSGTVGTRQLHYKNCVDNAYGATMNGTLRVTIAARVAGSPATDATFEAIGYHVQLLQNHVDLVINAKINFTSPTPDSGKATLNVELTDNASGNKFWMNNVNVNLTTEQCSGEIAHSKFGRVNSQRFSSVQSTLSGVSSAISTANTNNALVVDLDADGDGLQEWKSRLKEIRSDEDFSNPQSSPVLTPQANVAIDRNTASEIELLDIDDSDGDFVSVSLRPVQNMDLQQSAWSQFSITSSVAGDYLMMAVVTDQTGRSASTNFNLRVRLDTPIIEPGFPGVASVNEEQTVNLLPANSDQGPFTYTIISAPAGTSIDGNGMLHWTAYFPIYWPDVSVQFIVRVSNQDHVVDQIFTVPLHDSNASFPVTFTGEPSDLSKYSFELDNAGRVSAYVPAASNIAAVFTDNGTEISHGYYSIRDSSVIDKILHADHTAVGGVNVNITTNKIIVTASSDNSAISSIENAVFAPSSVPSGQVIDVDGDGNDELIVIANSFSGVSVAVLLLPDLSVRWNNNIDDLGIYHVGNVDEDQQLELIGSRGHVIDLVSGQVQWHYSESSPDYTPGFGESFFLWDLDGDGIDEIANAAGSYMGNQLLVVTSAVTHSSWRNGVYILPTGAPSINCGAACGIPPRSGEILTRYYFNYYGSGATEHRFHYDANQDLVVYDGGVAFSGTTFVREMRFLGNNKYVLLSTPATDEIYISLFDAEALSVNPQKLLSNFHENLFSGGMNHRDESGEGPLFFVGNYDYNLLKFSSTSELQIAKSDNKIKKPLAVLDSANNGYDNLVTDNGTANLLRNFYGDVIWSNNSNDASPLEIIAASQNSDPVNIITRYDGRIVARNAIDGEQLWDIMLHAFGIATQNANGNTNLIVAHGGGLSSYYFDDNGTQLVATVNPASLAYAKVGKLVIEDVDGDGIDEIFASVYGGSSSSWRLCSFNGANFTQRYCTTLESYDGAFLVYRAQNYSYIVAALKNKIGASDVVHTSNLAFFDASSGAIIWQSPELAGRVANDGLQVIANGREKPSLSIATDQAIYFAH